MKRAIPDTVCELLEQRVELSPRSTACFSHSPAGECATYHWQAFRDRAIQLCGDLQPLVDAPGMVAAIRLPTSLTYELLTHALMRLGCVVVGVDCQASAADGVSTLRQCGARLLITDSAWLAEVGPEAASLVNSVVVIDDRPFADSPDSSDSRERVSSQWTGRLHRLRELRERNGGQDGSAIGAPPSPGDLATIIFTSGTTGEPKGIPFRHEQIMAACRAIVTAYPEIGTEDQTICWLPLSALFQRMVNLFSMACGMRTHYIADPRHIASAVAELRPSFLVGVPRFFEKLHEALQDDAHAKLRESARQVKYMISGSAPLSSGLLESLRSKGILVLEAYGLSENAVPNSANRCTDYRFGSVGKPLWPNQLRLASDGEVEVKGIGLFDGYLGQSSEASFTEDGYYRTGDLGSFDVDGFLYLTGRKRDLIKTSTGRRIGPSRIEAVYGRCPSIDQIIVVGNGRKYLAALVTLKASHPTATADDGASTQAVAELLDEFRSADEVLSEHERVQAFGILGRPFQQAELTSSQKLRRNVIARNYAELIERLYKESPPCILVARPQEMLPKEQEQA